ncbi:hypothetical protein HHK36_011550 [Tetracentron sinense]|uniref:Phytocyanin domain-containing protein n=1 Tax=Tetracentron sinense TaxID=13715 RepID=A0A834ZGI8_TETSI|nr:hypothetical protein HHK36_011550 [Tetracentron sinense]
MASKQLLVILATVMLIFPAVTIATEYVVGDESGWTIKFDYEAWAKDKQFFVGDKLVFKYPVGVHNVFKVNGTGFKECIVPPANLALSTGNDEITLATPGNKWYICGVAKHCADGGQKLSITVLSEWSAPAPAPSSPSTNAANGIFVSGYGLLIAALIAIVMIIV